ncbi:NYN domain-containing protein [Caldilinea sp.]|uniref:NYN domain-containing protein n=1 Tax=Caldilinea sp. TaxID=2293560 RepID=UPI002B779203|nr:NYN domain-containing protein [Caldilinea sp.]
MSNQLAVFMDFENIALWAEQEFLDFELTPLMEYLENRGAIAILRAYGDWSRFSRYREDLMNHAVDLIQIFSIRAGKNRADIRMALDALEVAIQRTHIDTFIIISGDSDFGPLVTKLREYGKYTLGIGPREVTHPLLVRACDEFIYLEVALGELADEDRLIEPSASELESARQLLLKALRVHAQRSELPVLAAKLKQTMLLLDSTFSEASIGHTQFKTWLEQNTDILTLFIKDHQLYVAPSEFDPTPEWEDRPWRAGGLGNSQQLTAGTGIAGVAAAEAPVKLSLRQQYNQIFTRLKMTSVDFATRRDVLRDIYRELSERSGERTTDELLDELCDRYEAQGLIRSKTTLRQIWQMGFRQRAFDYHEQVASVHVPVWLDAEIDSEAAFVQRAESGFVYAVVNAGLEIDKTELAIILLNDGEHTEYIDSLLEDLEQRGLVIQIEGRYMLPGHSSIPFADEPALQPIIYDIENVQLPDSMPRGFEKARSLSKTAMLQRSQDFAASARSYLMACRLQWDAVEAGEPGAVLEDLRWYMASYASVRAGELSQIHRDYAHSRPYYLAFFFLVQEDDPLWSRMRGLINPMLSYYWVNAWRELGLNAGNPSLSATTPAEIAVRAATHETPDLCGLWYAMSNALAEVNPGLVRRVASQIRLNRGESPTYAQVADTLEQMLMQ